MKKTKQTSTKLLVIAVAAIIAAATITSISLARPAFAEQNCTTSGSVRTCSGGTSNKAAGFDTAGGFGAHVIFDTSTGQVTSSGGGGGNDGTTVGGNGGHTVCNVDGGDCSTGVGGSGKHPK